MLRRLSAAVAALATAAIAACGGDSGTTTEPPPGPPPGPAPVATVQINPAAPSIYTGRTLQLTVTLKDATGKPLAGRTVTWMSAAQQYVTVSGTGLITGVAAGESRITATSEGKSAEVTVTVSDAPVASVHIDPANLNIGLGQTVTLKARAFDDQNTELTGREIAWTSESPLIAAVNAQTGVVTGVAAGHAKISATSEGKSASVTVNVTVPVASVQVMGAVDTLEAYDVVPMTAVLRDNQGNVLNGRTVTWSSSNPAVASIDAATGVLTGVDRGTVTITATSEGKQGTASRVVVIKYRSITAGTMHACDIASGGIVWCWGLNGVEGRVGDPNMGNSVYTALPYKVSETIRFKQLSSFGRHTCGIAIDDRAYCWGYNGWGGLGSGTEVPSSPTPLLVAGGIKFRQISAGSDHSCGVSLANTAYCWGHDDWRQLGDGKSGYTTSPVAVQLAEAVRMIEAGPAFSCAVTIAGKAYCWGANSIGQVGDGQPIAYGNVFVALPNEVVGNQIFASIDLGNQYTCGTTFTGNVYCWGRNGNRFGNGPQGVDASSPQLGANGMQFKSISTGFEHACGVAQDLGIWCWGSNGNGRLGVNLANGSSTPVRVNGNLSGQEVAASGIGTGSGSHTCAISVDRLTVLCWGRNDVGQLGNGQTTTEQAINATPVIVVGQKPL